MQLVAFSEILRGAFARFDGRALTDIQSDEFDRAREIVTRRLEEGWIHEEWPDLVRVEHRQRLDYWNPVTNYVAGNTVLYATDSRCYVANQATTSVPGADTTWTPLERNFGGDIMAATDTAVPGDFARVASTGVQYVCITATTGGPPGAAWYALPSWTPEFDPEDTDYTVDMGDVLGVWTDDPRDTASPEEDELAWRETTDGLLVANGDRGEAWFRYRTRPPTLTGSAWSSATAYALAAQVYYDNGTTGDFWECVTATSAGESPVTAAAKWSQVDVPKFMHRWLVHSACADLCLGSGLAARAADELELAETAIADAVINLHRARRQTRRMRVS
jgi:hypothetical protein